eukprot:scaffold16551_cov100-Skeletonema_dohrnii-CCMP3373.AAC.1
MLPNTFLLLGTYLEIASPFKERRAIPFDRTPDVHAIHCFRGRRPLTKVMATTLTAFYSTFVMPSWRGMLTSQREDEQATLHRTAPSN